MNNFLMMENPLAQVVVDFLNNVGLRVTVVPGAKGFIDDVAIVDGELHVDPKCRPSGILHEAGHLAVIPKKYRSWFSGNLDAGWKRVLADADVLALGPDDPLSRALMQASDPEVTAWAWAVGKHLGIPDESIIMDDEYDNGGEVLRMQLNGHAYIGINGLSHGGFCVRRANQYTKLPEYPLLQFWLQP